jgi:hypothetical protein
MIVFKLLVAVLVAQVVVGGKVDVFDVDFVNVAVEVAGLGVAVLVLITVEVIVEGSSVTDVLLVAVEVTVDPVTVTDVVFVTVCAIVPLTARAKIPRKMRDSFIFFS